MVWYIEASDTDEDGDGERINNDDDDGGDDHDNGILNEEKRFEI